MKSNIIDLARNDSHSQQQRILQAKWSYTTRRVPSHTATVLRKGAIRPKAGDLMLAKVTRLGQHQRIELVNGRRARMFVGDDIVVVYGNRYAPDQFEAIVPTDLKPCKLVAAGGIAAEMIVKHGAMKKPTAITPVGLVCGGNGKVMNLIDYAVAPQHRSDPLPPVIAVVGGSMNAGKTTTAASLVRGLTRAGFHVTAGKVTGTGSGNDPWHLTDAGARRVMDYLDTGHPSTYLLPPDEVEAILTSLLSHLNEPGTDFIVLEIADGLFQSETARLLASDLFRDQVDGVLFAASDALGAVYGVEMLQRWDISVFGVSGVITRSPLGMREVLDAIDIPVLSRRVLSDPGIDEHVASWLHNTPSEAGMRGSAR